MKIVFFYLNQNCIVNISFDISSGSSKDNLISNLPYNTFVIMNNARNTHLTEENTIKEDYHNIFKSRYADLFSFFFSSGFFKTIFSDGSCPNTDDCEFCDIRMLGFKPSLNMLRNLTPNIKYVVADFRSIKGTAYWYIIVFGNFKSNVRLFSVLYRIKRVKVHRYSENRINFLKLGVFVIIDTLEHFRELFAEL